MQLRKMVSVILSIHNEYLNLEPLIERIITTLRKYPHLEEHHYEIIMVDDASTDSSWTIMEKVQEKYPAQIVLAQHESRRGQKGCFMTGFKRAKGKYSVLMDADLQVLPEELPLVLDKVLLENYEIVCTFNDAERGGKRRGLVSRIGNVFMKAIFNSPVKDAGANFMGIETRYIRNVELLENDQRYLLPISMQRGLTRVTEIGCVFGLRQYGKSKYNKLRKAILGIPEMIRLRQRLDAGIYDLPEVPEDNLTGLTMQKEVIDDHTTHLMLCEDSSSVGDATLHYLSWDSDVLEVKSGKISNINIAEPNNPQVVDTIVDIMSACQLEARQQKIEFVTTRIDSHNHLVATALEKVGFRLIECYVTLMHSLNNVEDFSDERIRLSQMTDMDATAQVAFDAFEYSRFLMDTRIDDDKARFSRAEWVRNGFKGRADAIYVAVIDEQICGFVLLKDKVKNGESIGSIDLIAVKPNYSGQGIGKALVQQSLKHYQARDNFAGVEVGTQAANISALNLYIRNGFSIDTSEYTFHWHSEG